MKFQLFILSALLVSAFALPVPDEEVSPVKSVVAVPEIKPEDVQKPVVKPVDVVKPEARAEGAGEESKKLEEEKKIDLPASAPDAEIAQLAAEKKPAELKEEKLELEEKKFDAPKEEKKEEPKAEEKREEKKVEKTIRADDAVQAVKALPVVEDVPIVSAVAEEEKQIIEEQKPVVQEVQPVGKSASLAEAPAAEQKKEELSAAEGAPAIKSDLPAASAAPAETNTEEKKTDELATRQEKAKVEGKVAEDVVAKVDNIQVVAQKPVVAESAVVPEVKSLKDDKLAETAAKPELPAEAAEKIEQAAAPALAEPASELKTVVEAKPAEAKKPEESTATVGDISKQQSSEESSQIKVLQSEAAPAEQKQETLAAEIPASATVGASPLAPGAAAASAASAPEGKKIENASAAAPAELDAPAGASAAAIPEKTEQLLEKKEEGTLKLEGGEPLKKLDELKPAAIPADDKKSNESESNESEESKESGESKEDKSN